MNVVYFLTGVIAHALGATLAAATVVAAIVFPILRKANK